jgi:hypothetical protein
MLRGKSCPRTVFDVGELGPDYSVGRHECPESKRSVHNGGPFFEDYIGGNVPASSGANAGFMGWQPWGVTWGNQSYSLSTVVLQQAVFQNGLLTVAKPTVAIP